MLARLWLPVAVLLALASSLALLAHWPLDPLKDVDKVAIAGTSGGPPGLTPKILDGLERAFRDRRIRVVSDPETADALLTLSLEDSKLTVSNEGFRARVPSQLEKHGRTYAMDLYVVANSRGLSARLEPRRAWENWLRKLL